MVKDGGNVISNSCPVIRIPWHDFVRIGYFPQKMATIELIKIGRSRYKIVRRYCEMVTHESILSFCICLLFWLYHPHCGGIIPNCGGIIPWSAPKNYFGMGIGTNECFDVDSIEFCMG